jgi:hypothetical protein
MLTRFRQSGPAAKGMPAPSYRTSLRVDQRGRVMGHGDGICGGVSSLTSRLISCSLR